MFRLLHPPWVDLTEKLASALRKADEIESSSEEILDTLVLREVDLDPGALSGGILRHETGPTVIFVRGGRKGMRRAILFVEGEVVRSTPGGSSANHRRSRRAQGARCSAER